MGRKKASEIELPVRASKKQEDCSKKAHGECEFLKRQKERPEWLKYWPIWLTLALAIWHQGGIEVQKTGDGIAFKPISSTQQPKNVVKQK